LFGGKRTHCKLYVNARVWKDGRRVDGQGIRTGPAPGKVGVSNASGHQHVLEICHPRFARSGGAVHRIERFRIALHLATRVGLEDAAELEWSVIVLELGLEARRVYHMRRRSEPRDNEGSEEVIIFGLEMLRVGRPFKEGSERVACGRIPECKAAFRAIGGLGCVRYDRGLTR